MGGECLDLPGKVAEGRLSEGHEPTLATLNPGPLPGLWGLRGGKEEQLSCYSGQGFMVPFPPIGAVGEIDELIRQFSSRPMTRQCEKEGGDLCKLRKFPRTGWAAENLTLGVGMCSPSGKTERSPALEADPAGSVHVHVLKEA